MTEPAVTAEGAPMEVVLALSEADDPADRGRSLGLRYGEEIARTVSLYRAFYRELGIGDEVVDRITGRCRAALAEWAPEIQEELDALAAGAATSTGVDLLPESVMAVTARTEILATVDSPREGECSTAILLPSAGGAPRTIQTWDWHASLVPSALVWQYVSQAGISVSTFTEFGAPAKIGVNGAGLGVHFNILHHASDHGDGGVPVHAVARRILDTARTVADAVDLARSAEVSASTVLTVVTDEPAAASIELCPDSVAVVGPQTGGEDGAFLLHTNHFLDEELALGERTPDVSTTYARMDHLRSQVGGLEGAAGADGLAAGLCGSAGAQAPICMSPDLTAPPADQWTTLLTVALDVERGSLECAPGDPSVFAARQRLVV